MRSLLAILLMVTGCQAASPSFSSFNTNQFSTNGLSISIRNGALVTNVVGAAFGAAGWYQSIGLITNTPFQLLSSGLADLLTVPSSYRFIPFRLASGTTNTSATLVTIYIKTNSIYYPVTTEVSVVTNQGVNLISGAGTPILEQGESLAVSNSTAGLNCILSGYFFPNTIPLYSPRIFNLAASDNVIYICPTNKVGKSHATLSVDQAVGHPSAIIVNRSGSTITMKHYSTFNGDSPGDGNIFNFRTLLNNTVLGVTTSGFFSEGQAYVLNSSATGNGLSAWITIYEDNE